MSVMVQFSNFKLRAMLVAQENVPLLSNSNVLLVLLLSKCQLQSTASQFNNILHRIMLSALENIPLPFNSIVLLLLLLLQC